jgi:hypothetical protein
MITTGRYVGYASVRGQYLIELDTPDGVTNYVYHGPESIAKKTTKWSYEPSDQFCSPVKTGMYLVYVSEEKIDEMIKKGYRLTNPKFDSEFLLINMETKQFDRISYSMFVELSRYEGNKIVCFNEIEL